MSSKYKAKEYADKKRHAKFTNFHIGDLVLLKNMMKQNKLSPEYENELYTITKSMTDQFKSKTQKENIAFVTKHMSRNISKDLSNQQPKTKVCIKVLKLLSYQPRPSTLCQIKLFTMRTRRRSPLLSRIEAEGQHEDEINCSSIDGTCIT